ncbi:MAG: ABC transporter ATP-binding protein [Burkholderiaceae bacterium]
MAEPALTAQGLSLMLGKRQVVRQFSAALQPGQWVAIVGPNGAGKSSLISMLAGLRMPAQGVVMLSGEPLTAIPVNQRARQMTWLAQQGSADGEIAAIDVVRLGRLPHHGLLGSPSRNDELAVKNAMQETQCLSLAARPLNQLSGGEQQRVLLARALAAQTPLLLLDEPTTHLDVPHQRLVVRSIKARTESGTAVIAALHDLTLALMADRVWLMDQGSLVIDTVPADPALHAALSDVFEQAMTIEKLERDDGHHFIVRPLI